MSEVWNPATPSQLVYPCLEAMNDACWLFAVLKLTDTVDTNWSSFFQFDVDATAGAATRLAFGRRSTGLLYYANSVALGDGTGFTDADGWSRVWFARSAAAATVLAKCPMGGSLTSGPGEAVADGLSNAGNVVKVGGDDDPFDGKMAAFGWGNATPPSDATLAALTSTAGLVALATHAYDAANRFQTDLVGTNHLTSGLSSITADGADNPSGWTYSGGAAAAGPPQFASKHRSMRALTRR